MTTEQTLVLAGHGSHHDPRSAAPVHAHADRLRDRGCFDAVRTAFWKEQPSLAEVTSTVATGTVYVVPLLTSEGYFADRVFPRELGLEGDAAGDETIVRYTDPVGTHERLVDVITERLRAVTDGAVDPADLGVALVGHGTERHEDSADATVAHADRLRAGGRYAAVEACFLDQAPFVGDLTDRFEVTDVAVVPLFLGHGHHVTRDVPAAVGLPADRDPFGGPTRLDGHRLWYVEAVGTAPALADLVLERAAEAGADVRPGSAGTRAVTDAEAAFLRWLGASPAPGELEPGLATRRWGELAVTVTTGTDRRRRYAIRHVDDRHAASDGLDDLGSTAAVRQRTGTDDAGRHRPLRTARTLPTGWRFETADGGDFLRAVRAVYPGSLDHWHRDRQGTLETADLEAVVARQAGRYREVDEHEPAVLAATVEACCGDCVRRRAWSAEGVEPEPSAGTFACPEPCSFLLEAARTFAEMEPADPAAAIDPWVPVDRAAPDGPSVPAAAFDRPGNRYRARFQHARGTDETLPQELTPDP